MDCTCSCPVICGVNAPCCTECRYYKAEPEDDQLDGRVITVWMSANEG